MIVDQLIPDEDSPASLEAVSYTHLAPSFVRFLLVCPPMAYIYTILCMGLIYRLLPGKISYDIIYGDVYKRQRHRFMR